MGKIHKVGIVGTGFGATGHIPIFQMCPDTKVVALCGRNHLKTKLIADKHNIQYVYSDYMQMIANEEIDIICIAVPSYLHVEIAIEAIKVGKHVLCEKPMGISTNDAKVLCDYMKKYMVSFGVNYIWRFTPQRRKIKYLIDNGYLGQVFTVNVNSYADFIINPPNWNWLSVKKMGGGTIYNWGSHAIDTLCWWFGDIEEVYCIKRTNLVTRYDNQVKKYSDADDTFSFIGRFVSGGDIIGQFGMVSNSKNTNFKFELRGSQGTIILDRNNQLLVYDKNGNEFDYGKCEPFQYASEATSFEGSRLLPQFYMLAQQFVHSINNEIVFSPSCEEGLKTLSVLEALIISSEVNKPVRPLDVLLGKEYEA